MARKHILNQDGTPNWDTIAGFKERLDGHDISVASNTSSLASITSVIVNVKDYGAKGDGISDDAPAIRSAMSYANGKGGGTIYFPAGTYVIKSIDPSSLTTPIGIRLLPNVKFKGEGRASVIKQGDNMISQIYYLFGEDRVNQYTPNISFRDLTIDMNAPNNAVTSAIESSGYKANYPIIIRYIDQLIVDNVYFLNCPGRNTIQVSNQAGNPVCGTVIISNCEFRNLGAGNSNASLQNDHSTLYLVCTNAIVLNSYFHNDNTNLDYSQIFSNAIELHAISCFVRGCKVENMRYPFILSAAEQNMNDVLIQDCQFYNSESMIYAYVAANMKIGSVTLDNVRGTMRASSVTEVCIDFQNSVFANALPFDKVTIRNCDSVDTLDNTAINGVYSKSHNHVAIKNANEIEIVGNRFVGSGGKLISITPIDGVTNVKIKGNTLQDCALALPINDVAYQSFISLATTFTTNLLDISGNQTIKSNTGSRARFLAYLIGNFKNLSVIDNICSGYNGEVSIPADGLTGQKVVKHAAMSNPKSGYAVSASLGSTWVDLSTGVKYQKNNNHNSNTGWVPQYDNNSGTTSARPTGAVAGYSYFDTTLNKPIVVKTTGTTEVDTLTVNTGATASGNITITLNGVSFTVSVTAGDSITTVADKIRNTFYAGWGITGNMGTASITFTKGFAGTNTTPTFTDTGTTGVTASFTVTAGTNPSWVDSTGTAV